MDFESLYPSSAKYIFANGLRKVEPYEFSYLANTKARWASMRSITDVFTTEFKRRCDRDMIVKAIQDGRILVNDVGVQPSHRVCQGDLICTRSVHRHEPAVPDWPIEIAQQEDGLLVVDKPHGLPVHPNSLYYFNTLLTILRKDMALDPRLQLVHRLDGLTSGIVILADPDKRPKLFEAFEKRLLQKVYVARVQGRFPEQKITCNIPLHTPEGKGSGRQVVARHGKPTETIFHRIRYDANGDYSIVQCILHTGRRHQIRAHLSLLGYPILNDPLYNDAYPASRRLNQMHTDSLSIDYPLWPDAKHTCQLCSHPAPDPDPLHMAIDLRAVLYAGKGWRYQSMWPAWAN
ncbi:hypothetical protein BZG36_00715 [Bifiguratus adelaidae]|uniref:Pseudouridine synthase n=1 Tax=Bifiguratus adelaidae TaxID=1938954 RepID=A0A261Y731_9FUNG|nr:hypothetical protein BZG36_00715 [Bifiguratus adelaidae]